MDHDPKAHAYTRQEIEARREAYEPLSIGRGFAAPDRRVSGAARARARLGLLVLGSGSKGNASIVFDRSTNEGILIDAGICKRDVFAFSEQGGFSLSGLRGIFITHCHSDHVKNLGVVLRALDASGITVPLFVHSLTLAASKELQRAVETHQLVLIDGCSTLEVGSLTLRPLATSHDAEVSFGLRVECGQDALGFITDTGVITQEMLEALRGVRILGLESNHDEDMLENGPYPRALKQRVGSHQGHLSNAQAADALEALISDRLETVVALHISEHNNTYRLPVETLRAVVERVGASTQVTCAYQKRPVFIVS